MDRKQQPTWKNHPRPKVIIGGGHQWATTFLAITENITKRDPEEYTANTIGISYRIQVNSEE